MYSLVLKNNVNATFDESFTGELFLALKHLLTKQQSLPRLAGRGGSPSWTRGFDLKAAVPREDRTCPRLYIEAAQTPSSFERKNLRYIIAKFVYT